MPHENLYHLKRRILTENVKFADFVVNSYANFVIILCSIIIVDGKSTRAYRYYVTSYRDST